MIDRGEGEPGVALHRLHPILLWEHVLRWRCKGSNECKHNNAADKNFGLAQWLIARLDCLCALRTLIATVACQVVRLAVLFIKKTKCLVGKNISESYLS